MKYLAIFIAVGAILVSCQQPKQPVQDSTGLVLKGKIVEIQNAPLEQCLENWIIKLKVEQVVKGSFGGEYFSFRVHSPSRSGLEEGKEITLKAERTEDGYTVDDFQWMKGQ